MSIRKIRASICILLAAGLFGCAGGGSTPSSQADPTIRVINGSPETTGIDVLANEDMIASAIPYLGSTPDFADLKFIAANLGGYDVVLRSAGGSTDLDRIAPAPPVFDKGTHQLAVIVGLSNPGGELPKRSQIVMMRLDRKAPTGNKARVIVMNALERAAGFENRQLSFQSIIPGDPNSVDNPLYKLENVNYAQDKSGSPIFVDAGSVTFIARVGDVDAVQELARTTFAFGSGKLYLALITGQEGNANPALQPKIQFIELQTKD